MDEKKIYTEMRLMDFVFSSLAKAAGPWVILTEAEASIWLKKGMQDF
jgi:hypothetical protein